MSMNLYTNFAFYEHLFTINLFYFINSIMGSELFYFGVECPKVDGKR